MFFLQKIIAKRSVFLFAPPRLLRSARSVRFAPALSSHKRGASQLFLAAVYLYGVNAFVQMLQSQGVAVAACPKGRLMKQLSANRIDTDGERT